MVDDAPLRSLAAPEQMVVPVPLQQLVLLQIELLRRLLQEVHELRRHERHDDRKLHEELAAIAAAIKAGSTDPILNQEAEKLTALAAKLGQIAPAGPAENVPT